jgi:hypothetical protein
MCHVDLHAVAGGWQEARQEDVCRLRQLVEDFEAVVGSEIDTDAALAPVGLLDHEVDRFRTPAEHAGRDQAPLRVTRLRDARP